MKDSILRSKSFYFAVRIVKLHQYLAATKREFTLSKQLLRSGTSIGAMVREAAHAESRADFVHKLSIAQKEANESLYWLELLEATSYLTTSEASSLHQDAVELVKLLTSSLKTVKSN